MKARHAVLVALAAAVTLTSVAAAGPDAAKQRVAIMTKGAGNASRPAAFVLTPLQVGALKRDSGTTRVEGALRPERVVMRDGQRVTIYDSIVETLTGERGRLVTVTPAELEQRHL